MVIIIILAAFLIGRFSSIGVYKYELKNSSVILPIVNKYDEFRDLQSKIEISYKVKLDEYNRENAQLEKQRKEFYEKNPNFPIKTMYMQVIAPPQKVSISFLL